MFVTTSKENAKTSQEAREFVYNYFEEEGFANEGSRWSSGLADWFVIGGRWSGELSTIEPWHLSFEEKVSELLKLWYPDLKKDRVRGIWFGEPEGQEKKALSDIEKLWKKTKPKALKSVPYNRYIYSYHGRGYEDDAKIITKELYDTYLKEFESDWYKDGEHHVDIDYDPVSPDFIGKKWIVVVDYHY